MKKFVALGLLGGVIVCAILVVFAKQEIKEIEARERLPSRETVVADATKRFLEYQQHTMEMKSTSTWVSVDYVELEGIVWQYMIEVYLDEYKVKVSAPAIHTLEKCEPGVYPYRNCLKSDMYLSRFTVEDLVGDTPRRGYNLTLTALVGIRNAVKNHMKSCTRTLPLHPSLL